MKRLFTSKVLYTGILLLLITTNSVAQINRKAPGEISRHSESKNTPLDAWVEFDTSAIGLVFPTPYCPTKTTTPTFKWKSNKSKIIKSAITYEFTLVEMNLTDSTMDDFDKRKVIANVKGIKNDSLIFPQNIAKLEMRKLYGWQVKQYENGKLSFSSIPLPFYIIDYKLPFNIEEITCCANNIIANGTFEHGLVRGTVGQQGRADNWDLGYGKPIVVTSEDGCSSPGYIRLYGNKKSGSCITQTLQIPKIQAGKHYRFSACFRLSKVQQNTNYAYIKVVAFNGNLPTTTQHPLPSSTISIIGWSGKLMQKEWITFSLNVWTANKAFDKIGIYCCTDADDTATVCDIDKICFIETKDERSCDDYNYTENGSPIIDTSLLAQAQNQVYTYYEQNNGHLADLYNGYNGTTSFYQQNDDCASIGGQVPESVLNYSLDDTLKDLGVEGGISQFDEIFKSKYKDTSKQTVLGPIGPLSNSECKISYTPDNTVPFSGRDIIFVHGLKLEHLCARANGTLGADKNWPKDKSEFYSGGYYKKVAEEGWADHIQEWLRSRGYKNRVLVVAYNCSQRADVAAHAMLSQIREAMEYGTGVDFVKGDKRENKCFGRDAVIISHSTGALVTDIAMSIAEKSKYDPIIKKRYGNVGFILANMKLHVALQGAFNGSWLAPLYLAAENNPVLSSVANEIVCRDIKGNPYNTRAIALQSILIDLQPSIASTLWRPVISTSPVSTITVAGGHAVGTYEFKGVAANVALHPGFDDGVLTIGCQSANPFPESIPTPVGFTRHPFLPKLYDMGTAHVNSYRANCYFLNQTHPIPNPASPIGIGISPFVAGASTAFLSPTGMVQPVAAITPSSNPENRIPNHYSFLQSASDHYKGPRGKKPGTPYSHNGEGYDPNNHAGTSGFRYLNYDYSDDAGRHWEESLVVTNTAVFSKGFINSSVSSLPEETVKGEYLDFDVYGPQFSFKWCCKFKYLGWLPMFHVRIPIWERKYHLMSDSDTECESGYVYKYILR